MVVATQHNKHSHQAVGEGRLRATCANQGEKRGLALQLTQQGTLYADKLLKELYAIEDEVCQTFGTMQQLNESLEKFSQVLYRTGAKHNTAK